MAPVAHTLASADRRLDILKSAAAAFRRHGYRGASVDGIASALKMTKGNLYYYFRNKEDILCACHDHSLDALLALLATVQATASAPDVTLRALLRALVPLIVDGPRGATLALDVEALSPPRRRAVTARRDRFDHGLRAVIQDGMDQDVLAPSDPTIVALAMMGAVTSVAARFDPTGPLTSDQVGSACADYLVRGLLTR